MLSLFNDYILKTFFSINTNIFRHLKLEIALAIPASSEWKIVWKNRQHLGLTKINKSSCECNLSV